jgi:hypothetical protein
VRTDSWEVSATSANWQEITPYSTVSEMSADERLAEFLARFTPEIADRAAGALDRLRARLPGAVELVYDNYNALVIGFGPTERPSDAPLSIAVYARSVALCFLRGSSLSDPHGILRGEGKLARNVAVNAPEDLDDPAVQDLIAQALRDRPPWDPQRPRTIIIQSVSAKQRPRRPG